MQTSLSKHQQNSIQMRQEITPDLFGRFVAFVDASPATMHTYSSALKDFARYLDANGIRQPQREDIINYREELKSYCKPATVQLRLVTVRLFFQWTEVTGLYPDIAQHIKGPKISQGYKKDALEPRQLNKILDTVNQETAQGRRDMAILLLMITGGLRDIEIQRANIEDLQQRGSALVLYLQGKGKEEKTDYIKIVPEVETALKRYLETRIDPEPGAPLFVSMSNNSTGRRLSTRSISGLVKSYMKSAGYDSERLTAHSLRHSAVTQALKGGATLQEAQQFARHAHLSTTLIYSHNLQRDANRCEAIIAGEIFNRKEESGT